MCSGNRPKVISYKVQSGEKTDPSERGKHVSHNLASSPAEGNGAASVRLHLISQPEINNLLRSLDFSVTASVAGFTPDECRGY